jgi:hypothetical protein
MKKIGLIITISLALCACNKPEPNPELKDPIYSDLNAQLAAATQALEAEKKTLEGHKKELEDVVPQTGQIKYAKKRIYESEDKITHFEQEKSYLELRVESRKREARKSYLISFKEKKDWPDPKEWESYQAEQKLRKAKATWDVKARMKEAGVGAIAGAGGKKEGEGGEKAEKAPAKE